MNIRTALHKAAVAYAWEVKRWKFAPYVNYLIEEDLKKAGRWPIPPAEPRKRSA